MTDGYDAPPGFRPRRQPCRDWILRAKPETCGPTDINAFRKEASDLLSELASFGDGSVLPAEKERMTLRSTLIAESEKPDIESIRCEADVSREYYEIGRRLTSVENIQKNEHDRAMDHSCDINNDLRCPPWNLSPITDVGAEFDTVIRLCVLKLWMEKVPGGKCYKRVSKIILETDVRPDTQLEAVMDIAFDDGMLGHTRDLIVEMRTSDQSLLFGDVNTIAEMAIPGKFSGPLTTTFAEIPLQIGRQIYIRPQYSEPLGMVVADITYRSCASLSTYPVVVSLYVRRMGVHVTRCHICMEWPPKLITKNAPYTMDNTYIQWCEACFHAWHTTPIKTGEVAIPPDLVVFPYANKAVIPKAKLHDDPVSLPVTMTDALAIADNENGPRKSKRGER